MFHPHSPLPAAAAFLSCCLKILRDRQLHCGGSRLQKSLSCPLPVSTWTGLRGSETELELAAKVIQELGCDPRRNYWPRKLDSPGINFASGRAGCKLRLSSGWWLLSQAGSPAPSVRIGGPQQLHILTAWQPQEKSLAFSRVGAKVPERAPWLKHPNTLGG